MKMLPCAITKCYIYIPMYCSNAEEDEKKNQKKKQEK